jgi:hypothetical protein
VQHGIGVGLVQMIRNHLVQGPAFGKRYLISGLALMLLRQGAVQGICIVPQIDAGCVRNVVRHVAPDRREQSLSMSHHCLILLAGYPHQNLNQVIEFIDDLSDFNDNTKCIFYVNKLFDN